ncbi:MAG TPA: PQQ-dependent sugar dehydrogenase [Pyrinomonadaceae bacterium]|jgi:glucose/arabinose dehydrogenase|nr:PQQ-dependent sugar dehydrogenase [Pyrinomonadaceae bacterium]
MTSHCEIKQGRAPQATIARQRLEAFFHRTSRAACGLALLVLLILSSQARLFAATLPSGFMETLVTSGLSNPTAMAFAPDGRIFVCQQGGQLRVIKNGSLLATPFLTVTVDSQGERGLLGLAFDPNFNTNHFIYIYYTATTPALHNRVSRFTANGDVAVAGSELTLLDLNNLSSATNHNGGAMHFGPDGKLYIAVGENATPANSQSLSNLLGKILRINADGTIPTDNPTSFPGITGTTSGVNRAIWSVGLRNPYTFAFQNGTGRMFINDVGQNTWEEINDGRAGVNYGWPTTEGPTTDARFVSPLFWYGHGTSATTGCAITGGAFYNPATNQFPSDYTGTYFFADFCSGWIRRLNPASGNTVTDFASGINSPVDLQVGSDGSLYYLARGAGAIYKVQYTASLAPSITTQPASQSALAGQPVTFSVAASGSQPLSYQWQRNGVNINGATGASYTIPAVAPGDNNAHFRVIVTNTFGSTTSNDAILTIQQSNPPTGIINAPANGSFYNAGDTINYSGTATDPEDGVLPPSAFTWQVDFHHDTHVHPFIPATTGSRSGSFVIPTLGETSTNVWYRIILTVTDSGGLTHTSYVEIFPRVSTISLAANFNGLLLTVDGQPQATPFNVNSVVGMTRSLGAISPQTVNGVTYEFETWSDGGAATHDISTPATATTYTAIFHIKTTSPSDTIQFAASAYNVNESEPSATITLTRSGNLSLAATVDFAASNGTASDRSDYTTALGTLTFEAGVTSKTFNILLTDDAYVENNETVNLTLSNPTNGTSLGTQSTALLVINDNDTIQPVANPADDAQFFVRQHYHDFLNREPDPGGLGYWTFQINKCNGDALCIHNTRIGVSAAFFVEQEFQQTGYFVYRIYKAALGRRVAYLEFMKDRSRLQVSGNLDAEKQSYALDFVQRAEFQTKYQGKTTDTSFVDALLQIVRDASGIDLSSKRAELMTEYDTGSDQTDARARTVRKLIEYPDYLQGEYNRAFVLAQYFGYLRRDPDESGYLFWLDVLNNKVPNNYRSMVCAFITSAEYQDRFSPIRTHTNSECGP